MSTDESGEPWPYDHVDLTPEEPPEPHWTCPDGTCACNVKEGTADHVDHEIVLFDGSAKRMPGARCRVMENGTLLNKKSPYADGTGTVRVQVRPGSKHLQVDWAPKDTPEDVHYPYRKSYYLDLGNTEEQGVERRLHNIGYSFYPSLEENIQDFQRAYRQPQTGKAKDVAVQLAAFHDEAALPPKSGKADPPIEALNANDPGQASSKKSLVGDNDAKGDDPTPGGGQSPSGGGQPAGGKSKKGSASDNTEVRIRVRVRTRAFRLIEGAEVTVDAGGKPKTEKTKNDGFARFTILDDDFGVSTPRTFVTIKVKADKYGEDPGPGGTVKPGELSFTLAVDKRQLKPQPEQTLNVITDDGTRPTWRSVGVVDTSKDARFLDVVVMHECMNDKAEFPKIPTRKLSDSEVQKELMFHYVADELQLSKDSEYRMEGAALKPNIKDRIALSGARKVGSSGELVRIRTSPTLYGVTYLLLGNNVATDLGKKEDENEALRFTRDKFSWEDSEVSGIDQRLAVGIARFSKLMSLSYQTKVVYHIGFLGHEDTNTHMHGLAIDFGGCASEMPEKAATKKGVVPIRLGVDFHVTFHWGRVPMWDGKTVAANPNDSSKWKRLSAFSSIGKKPEQVIFDDDTNYSTVPPTVRKLHYRLDPPPFEGLPFSPLKGDESPSAKLGQVMSHFSLAKLIFKDAYDFFLREFSDQNHPGTDDPKLGPDAFDPPAPTPIDDPSGHLLIHPDYGKPNGTNPDGTKKRNGRGAHHNHIHAQLGKTKHPAARP